MVSIGHLGAVFSFGAEHHLHGFDNLGHGQPHIDDLGLGKIKQSVCFGFHNTSHPFMLRASPLPDNSQC